MAQTWEAKAAADVVERRWHVPVPVGDSLSSLATSASGVTVDSTDTDVNDAVITLSAGSAGTTGTVTVTATTTDGLSLSETFYIAIRVTTAQAASTVRDVCYFALRKIVGTGNDPEAGELDDAVERLNDLITLWALSGTDIGISDPLVAGDTLSLPDGYLAALKFNLRVACHSHYGADIDAYDADMAARTMRVLENALFDPNDLQTETSLSSRRWGFLAPSR